MAGTGLAWRPYPGVSSHPVLSLKIGSKGLTTEKNYIPKVMVSSREQAGEAEAVRIVSASRQSEVR